MFACACVYWHGDDTVLDAARESCEVEGGKYMARTQTTL